MRKETLGKRPVFSSSANLWIALLVLLFALTGVQSVSAKTADTRAAGLIAGQRAFFDAIIAKNYGYLDDRLAKDYLGTYRAGIIDKEHEAKDLRAFPLVEYRMSEIRTVFPSRNTGIICFRFHVKVVVEGKDYFEDDYISCVWTRRGTKWLLSEQTAAKVTDP